MFPLAGVTAIGYVRLSRARRSQLFLRSALQPRHDEELTPSWRAGPVQPPTIAQARELENYRRGGREEKGKEEDPEEDGEGMKKKDGTQI